MIHGEDDEWLSYRSKFNLTYDQLNYSNLDLQSWVMQRGHLFAEKGFSNAEHFSKVIEVGAGTGEHIRYINHGFDEYTITDSDSKVLGVARKKISNNDGLSLKNIKYDLQDATTLDYSDDTFDRLIAVHVLEHLYYPHLVLKEWNRLVKPGGIITILIPTDPGMLWRFGRNLGPRNKANKSGIDYDYIMAREHVNSCHNLVSLIRHYFPTCENKWWPLGIALIDFNLFYIAHIKVS